MSDATVEGLQWHPEGHVAGRKGQVRKDPPQRGSLLAPGQGGRRVWGRERTVLRRDVCRPSNPSPAHLPAAREGGVCL